MQPTQVLSKYSRPSLDPRLRGGAGARGTEKETPDPGRASGAATDACGTSKDLVEVGDSGAHITSAVTELGRDPGAGWRTCGGSS